MQVGDSGAVVEHALAAMRHEAHKTASSHSSVHESICEVLQALGANYECNVLLENELLCIQTLVGNTGAVLGSGAACVFVLFDEACFNAGGFCST